MQGVKGPQYTEITKQAIIVGRNNIPVPPDEVELMAKIGCTDREIAEHFGINDQTMRRVFVDFLVKGRSELKQRLRQAQLKVAFDGNPTMLIFLGKNILGQADAPQYSEDNRALPWDDEFDAGTVDIEDVEDELQQDNNEV